MVSDSFTTLWTVAHQAPLSMGFPRQEHCSGVPCPPPGDLSNPGIDLHLLHWQVPSLPLSPQEPQGAITSLILKMTKIGREANTPVQVHTDGPERGNPRATHLVLPPPGGQLSWVKGKQRSRTAGNGGLLFKGPYSPGLIQMIPTGSHLGIQVSLCPSDSIWNEA